MGANVTFLNGTYTSGTTKGSGFRKPRGAVWGIFTLNVSTYRTNGTVDVTFEYYDKAAATWDTLKGGSQVNTVAFAQKTATGTAFITMAPGLTETANKAFSQVPPADIRMSLVVGAVGAATVVVTQAGD